jgi:HrpA-like RNA helicase
VETFYAEKAVSHYVRGSGDAVLNIHRSEGPGDILAFLPGVEEIEAAVEYVTEMQQQEQQHNHHNHHNHQQTPVPLVVLMLHASLPATQQARALDGSARRGPRRAIFATNIAETSLTLEHVRFVVDCGFTRSSYFDPTSGVSALITCPASRASAAQRAGRAGRTAPGKCFRLYTEHALAAPEVPAQTPPEMARCDLSPVVLQLKVASASFFLLSSFLSSLGHTKRQAITPLPLAPPPSF